jgi:queuine tRNA-ribosyltransferase
MHNLRYYQRLMAGLREAIAAGTLTAFIADFYARRQPAGLIPAQEPARKL